MANKYYNGASDLPKSSGNSIHRMPVEHAPAVKHATTRNVAVTKTSPQSDTENVKVSRDSITQALYHKE